MKHSDEWDLFISCAKNEGRLPDEIMDGLTKRQYSILNKWVKRDYWDFGVSLRTGWLTKEGVEHFRNEALRYLPKSTNLEKP